MGNVTRLVRERSSAICRVMAVGKDNLGKGWILMERMSGDLRNLNDHGVRSLGYVGDGRMHYVKDGQMLFDYIDTIKMMMDIERGMEDLHSTGFWRPPEVLQALKDGTKPVWSCEGDVYGFAMLCYELLTGRIPFGEHRLTDYDVVLSGQRPELPAHVNSWMRNLLHCCWQTEPQKRPGWTAIIEYLKELLASSSMKFRPKIEDQSAGSSSTGLREMEGLGQGRIKCHGHKWDVSGLGRFIPDREPPKLVQPCQVETLHQASAQRASNLLNELLSIRGGPQKVITFSEKLIAVLQKRVVGKLAAIWEEGGAKRVIIFSKERVQKTRATKVAVFWEDIALESWSPGCSNVIPRGIWIITGGSWRQIWMTIAANFKQNIFANVLCGCKLLVLGEKEETYYPSVLKILGRWLDSLRKQLTRAHL
ncbi:unnamed protein product [Sphagnum compactum]